jgi:hypothetical protein
VLTTCGALRVTLSEDLVRANPGLYRNTMGRGCRIHLGTHGLLAGRGDPNSELQLALSAAYVPTTTKAAMLSDFVPKWKSFIDATADHGITWQGIADAIDFRFTNESGLYWDEGQGYFQRFLMFSLRTIAAFSAYAHHGEERSPWTSASDLHAIKAVTERCGIDSPTALRDRIADRIFLRSNSPGDLVSPLVQTFTGTIDGHSAVLEQDEDGRLVATVSSFEWGMMVPLDTVMVREVYRIDAATADYLLWWAHRLHSYWTANGDEQAWRVGVCCARFAIGKVVAFAARMVHEFGHMPGGSKWHCSFGRRWANYCCMDFTQSMFGERCVASMGLPMEWEVRANREQPYAPFDVKSSEMPSRSFTFSGNDCEAATYTTHHCSYWQWPRPLVMGWSLPGKCSMHSTPWEIDAVFFGSTGDVCW